MSVMCFLVVALAEESAISPGSLVTVLEVMPSLDRIQGESPQIQCNARAGSLSGILQEPTRTLTFDSSCTLPLQGLLLESPWAETALLFAGLIGLLQLEVE
jgi:hypothetical protein